MNSDHAWILYLSPCHRIIFEGEIIVWGWEPVRYTRWSAHRTPALWFWHCWFAGRLLDIMGKFLLGFLHYAPPYPCHSRCAVYFNTTEPALFAQSASGYFSSAGQKYWFRLKIQPESIQTIIMAWGFRRYVCMYIYIYRHIHICIDAGTGNRPSFPSHSCPQLRCVW